MVSCDFSYSILTLTSNPSYMYEVGLDVLVSVLLTGFRLAYGEFRDIQCEIKKFNL